ncbi:MAG: response regulator [Anaerolineae bacterium]|nr:response regulator [Anaerolineae bacterium]
MDTEQLSVLLLDDDFHTRELFKLVFLHHSLPLETVTTIDEALDYLQTHTPSVVVVDLVMPETNGYEAFDAMRRLPSSVQMRFVATTAYHTAETPMEVRAYGFHGYLPKPFSVEDLVSELRRVTRDTN